LFQTDTQTKTILIVQCIAMLMGTSTHVMWAIENGFMSSNYNANFGSMLFWDSLTFLDPLAAFLLIFKPKTGLILTAVIIAIDVLHNNIFYFDELYQSSMGLGEWFLKYWMIFGQIVFAVFVFSTLKRNLREVGTAL
jgi:hypothetical protein